MMQKWQKGYWKWALGLVVLLVSPTLKLAMAQTAIETGTATVEPVIQPDIATLDQPAVLSPAEQRRRQRFMDLKPLPGPALPQVGAPEAPPAGSETEINENGPLVPGTFRIFSSTTPNAVIPAGDKSNINEPSTGMSGRVRFMTGNWYAAFSNNNGGTWTFIDPATAFRAADGGFCCDQVVMYEPSRDMMFWLLQYIKNGSTATSRGRFRLALFRNTNNNIGPAGWIFYDFFPSQVGGPAAGGEWFDYPHLALSNDFIYIAINVFRTTNDTWTRTVMLRLPLDPIRAGAALTFNFFSSTANFTFVPVQGAKDVMYWASHISTNSMRIFRWPEATTVVTPFDRAVPAWTSTTRGSSSCPTGDGQNWCLRTDHRVLAGALSWDHLTRQAELWWFWNVKQGGSFPQPYINAARFRERDLAYLSRPLIWSSTTVPWHYVAAAPNARGDIGLSLFRGAGVGLFPSHIVCIDDDFNGIPPAWECVLVRQGTNGPSNNGWGDYVAVRPDHPSGLGWHATGFTQQGGKAGRNVEPRNVIFGRERDLNSHFRWRLR